MGVKMLARGLAVNAARKMMDVANVEPAYVKALLRKPGPVNGGPKTRRMPWPRRRHFDHQERRAVMDLMTREMRRGGAIVYGGAEEKAYCQEFAAYLGGGFADAVNSGTNAVYLALRALDLEPGTEVVVPPITDAGGTMPVAMLNCIPVPADSMPGSLNSSVEQIRAVLTERTSAIVVAHIAGHPVDMDPIMALAAERGIPVVEDCAQALGATYKGRMASTLGTVSAFSTMFGKQHCTGAQGGVVYTHDTLIYARIRQAADRGKPHGAIGSPSNLVASLNFNQDEISMAIGRVQLAKLPANVARRRRFAGSVAQGMAGIRGVSLVPEPAGCRSSPWFLVLLLGDSVRCDSAQFAAALTAEGVDGVWPGYSFHPTDWPWHQDAVVYGASRLPWSLAGAVPRRFELPNAHAANKRVVRVEVHENLGEVEAADMVRAVGKLAAFFREPR